MKNQKGLTLVEMLIAMTLMSIVVLGATKVFMANSRIFTNNVAQSAFQSQARITLKALTTDIKSATKIEITKSDNTLVTTNGQGGPKLNLTGLNYQGAPQTVNYNLANTTLTRGIAGGSTQELAQKLANDEILTPLFKRTSQDSLEVNMIFNNSSMKPANTFTYSAVLNLKSKVLLTLTNDGLTTNNLNSVNFTSPTNGWAVGSQGVILNYANNAWNIARSANASNPDLNSVRFLSDNLGYAVGNSGTILKYDGSWATQTSNTTTNLNSVSPKDINDILAVGGNGTTSGVINSFDGTNWNLASGAFPSFNSVSQYLSNKYAAGNSGNVYLTTADTYLPPFGNPNFVFDSNNVLYYTSSVGSSAQILKYDNNGNSLGGILLQDDPDGNYPQYIALGPSGTFYTSDWVHKRVNKYNSNGFRIARYILPTNNSYPQGWLDGIASDSSGNVYAIDDEFDKIIKLDSNLSYVKTSLYEIIAHDIYVDRLDNLWIINGTRVSKLDKNTVAVSSFWTTPSWNESISADGQYVYTTINTSNHALMAYDYNGNFKYQKIICTSSHLYYQTYAIADFDNNVFASDKPNNRTVKYGKGKQRYWNKDTSFNLTNNDLRSVVIVPSSSDVTKYNIWVVGNGGLIFFLDSTNKIWTSKASPTTKNLNSVYFFNQNNGYAVGEGGTILRFNGTSFEQLESPTTENLNGVYLYGTDGGWIVGNKGTRIKIGEY